MSISFANPIANGENTAAWARAAGAAVGRRGLLYIIFLFIGEILLRDSDTLWQIRIGQWIVEHGAMPYLDVHSFTRLR